MKKHFQIFFVISSLRKKQNEILSERKLKKNYSEKFHQV